jgi:hypothetical protein
LFQCYATGFVSADNKSGNTPVYAGGLAGQFNTPAFTAENSIARGSVNAQSAASTSSAAVYAGGLVGHWNGTPVICPKTLP